MYRYVSLFMASLNLFFLSCSSNLYVTSGNYPETIKISNIKDRSNEGKNGLKQSVQAGQFFGPWNPVTVEFSNLTQVKNKLVWPLENFEIQTTFTTSDVVRGLIPFFSSRTIKFSGSYKEYTTVTE